MKKRNVSLKYARSPTCWNGHHISPSNEVQYNVYNSPCSNCHLQTPPSKKTLGSSVLDTSHVLLSSLKEFILPLNLMSTYWCNHSQQSERCISKDRTKPQRYLCHCKLWILKIKCINKKNPHTAILELVDS